MVCMSITSQVIYTVCLAVTASKQTVCLGTGTVAHHTGTVAHHPGTVAHHPGTVAPWHCGTLALELVGHYFVWHIQVLSWRICESQHKQLEESVIVHPLLAVVGHALAIICCAPVVVCCALVLYMVSCVGIMCWCHALASCIGYRWSCIGRPL